MAGPTACIENGSQTNFKANLPTSLHPEAKLAVKDDYSFGFLELEEQHQERELEKAIVSNIEGFLAMPTAS